MRSEEWAKPTRVKNKHKVKVSIERSDFAAEGLARISVGVRLSEMCECKKSSPSVSESFALFYPYDRLKLYPFKSRLNSFGYEFKLSHYGVWLLFAVVLRIWYEIVVSQILQITYVFSTPCQCVICRYGDDHGTSISQVTFYRHGGWSVRQAKSKLCCRV